jgi:hypothetical protein
VWNCDARLDTWDNVVYIVSRGTNVEHFMTESKNPGQVSAYLDEWTLKQIQGYAKSEDRSVSWVVGFAVKQFFVSRQANPLDASAALKRDPRPDYDKLTAPHLRGPVIQAHADTNGIPGRQVDLEDAIVAVVKRGPMPGPVADAVATVRRLKPSKHK